MTDVRQQLAEALDEAERQAKACGEGVTWSVEHRYAWEGENLEADCRDGRCECCRIQGSNGMCIYDEGGHDAHDARHIARWDPSTVLRLVERDRELLRLHKVYEGEQFPNHDGGYADALDDQLTAAAAFWLGTPEGSDG